MDRINDITVFENYAQYIVSCNIKKAKLRIDGTKYLSYYLVKRENYILNFIRHSTIFKIKNFNKSNQDDIYFNSKRKALKIYILIRASPVHFMDFYLSDKIRKTYNLIM